MAAEPPSRAAHNRMMRLLEDHYLQDDGKYGNADWSDSEVARVAEVPVEYVRQQRDKWFSQLAEPVVPAVDPALEVMRVEVETMRDAATQLAANINAAQSRHAAQMAEQQEQLQQLLRNMDTMTKHLRD